MNPYTGINWLREHPESLRRMTRYRSCLNAARTSDANSAGSSHAAKCPPRSTSLK